MKEYKYHCFTRKQYKNMITGLPYEVKLISVKAENIQEAKKIIKQNHPHWIPFVELEEKEAE